MDAYAAFLENQNGIRRAEARASLLASLGPRPEPQPLRLFARQVAPLAGPVEILHEPRILTLPVDVSPRAA
jgi:hypothetical protein